MKKLLIMSLAVSIVCSCAALEEEDFDVCVIRTGTTMAIVDADGKPVGRRLVKAGTRIYVPKEQKAAEKGARAGSVRLSSMSPTEFKAVKPKERHAFLATVNLSTTSPDEDAAKLGASPFCCELKIFNRTKDVEEYIFDAVAFRGTPAGRALYAMIKDGREHSVTVTLHWAKGESDAIAVVDGFQPSK